VALVSESGNPKKRKVVPSPSPAATLDAAKARTELKERGPAKEEALKLEKGADRKRDQEFGWVSPRTMEIPDGGIAGKDENSKAGGALK
jgi:hypothetical protein